MFVIFPTQNNVAADVPPFLAFTQRQQPISVIETLNIREYGDGEYRRPRPGRDSLAEWPVKGLNMFPAISDASGNVPQGRYNLNGHTTYYGWAC